MQVTVEKLTRYRNRVMTSFIVDDYGGVTPTEGQLYRQFSEWVESAGIKGEMSAVLGMHRSSDGRAQPPDPTFAAELSRSHSKHLEAFMEVMTHGPIYDFDHDRADPKGPHECVWLNQRQRPLGEYEDYFGHIAQRAQAAGFRHAGLTQPGCGCWPCLGYFFSNNLTWDAKELNPNVAQAMIALSKKGQLAGPVTGMFIGWNPIGPADARLVWEDGRYGVYELAPGIKDDCFEPRFILPQGGEGASGVDLLISADGQTGRLPQMLDQGTRTMIYYSHWGCVRPANTEQYRAFQEVPARLRKHYGDRIVWMRPSEIAAYRHTERNTAIRLDADGRSFTVTIPFEPPHPLSVRVMGVSSPRLLAPDGQELKPCETISGGAIFDLLPQNGTYRL